MQPSVAIDYYTIHIKLIHKRDKQNKFTNQPETVMMTILLQ